MSMSVSSGGTDEPMCDVNTTPLIDVMLVLLVMLIVTLPMQTHAVKLDMPRPTNAPPPPPGEVIRVDIDFLGNIYWNGETVDLKTIESYFRQKAGQDPQPEIHLAPERRAKYDVVQNVMAAAQRQHMVKMGFTNVSEFRD
jgi:biopolymer transport protein ExbD